MSKSKPEPTLREKAAALAVMASEVLLMVLDEPIAAVTPAAKPRTAKAFKPKGRPPMTDQQRAAAHAARKAEREAEAVADVPAPPAPKPQPVTRASLAAQKAEAGQVIDRRGDAAENPIVIDMQTPSSYFTRSQ